MTTRQMSESQIAKWSRDMVNQGVRVTRTKKGLLLRLPNGKTAMKHFTESDVRGPKNLAAELRRAGVTSPDDKKPAPLPNYITSGTITKKSREKIVQFIESHDFPSVVYSKDVVKELDMDPGTVNRILYHCGFTVGDALDRKGRPWYTPDELLALKKKEDAGEAIPEGARQIIDGARKAQEEIDRLTAPEAAFKAGVEGARSTGRDLGKAMKEVGLIPPSHQAEAVEQIIEREPKVPEVVVEKSSFHEGREFIDTHDSWTLDITKMPPPLSLESWLSVLQAAGLEYEIRVWRA